MGVSRARGQQGNRGVPLGLLLGLLLGLPPGPGVAAWADGAVGQAAGTSKAAREGERLIAELHAQIDKVNRSIEVTKEIIKRSEKRDYLPDLLFRLAELHAEKSRYLFLIEAERQGGSRMVVCPEAKLVKERAVRIYEGILADFPRWADNDKVLFFLAHEQRELGLYEEMTRTYQRLIDEYPKSSYRLEARLVLGDYCFDRSDLPRAESYYSQILAEPESFVHPMARYKLAWIRINQDRMKDALELLHRIVLGAASEEDRARGGAAAPANRVDVRREALIDMVFAYTEVKEPETALAFFEPLTGSRAELALVLDKLGNRYFVQQKWAPAAQVYRRLAEIAFDPQRLVEYVQRIARTVEETGDLSSADRDLALLARAVRLHGGEWRYPREEQGAVARELEVLARDEVTRLHEEARKAGNRSNLGVAADAYRIYLSTFPSSPQAGALRMNMAEALSDAGRQLEAGQAFEQVAATLPAGAEREESQYAAIVAYAEALAASEGLSPLALLRAQEGLKAVGASFIEEHPQSPKVPGVRFNIARLSYDQGQYREAAELLRSFVEAHPTLPEAPAAGHLALDALSRLEDLEGLVTLGKSFTEKPELPQGFRDEVRLIIEGKSQELAESVAVEAGTGPQAGAGAGEEKLLAFAAQHGGNPIGEVALLNAFAVYREKGNLPLMDEAASRFLRDYPTSRKVQDVLREQARTYLQVGRLAQAAQLFEAYARRFPQDTASQDLQHRAVRIYKALGEQRRVVELVRQLERRGDPSYATELRPLLVDSLLQLEDWPALEAEMAKLQLVPQTQKSAATRGRRGKRAAAASAGGADHEVALTLGLAALRQGNATRGRELFRAAREGEDHVAAQALFHGMELDVEEMRRIRLGPGADAEKVMMDKLTVLDRMEGALYPLIDKAVGEWIIAGLLLVGQAYGDIAETLSAAPIPPTIPEAERPEYRAMLAEQVAALQEKAKSAFSTCAEKAHELNVFNRYLVGCLHEGKLPPPDRLPGRARLPEASIQQRGQLEQVLAQSPKDTKALLALADLYLGAGDFRMARLLAARVLEMDPENGQARNRAALASLMLNEPAAAIFDFEAALVQGAETEARLNLATLYYLYGDTPRALEMAKGIKGLGRVDLAAPGIHPMAGYALHGMGLR